MSENLANIFQELPDTTIFEVPVARINFSMSHTKDGKIVVQTDGIWRRASLVKCTPRILEVEPPSHTQKVNKSTSQVAYKMTDSLSNKDSLFSNPILLEYKNQDPTTSAYGFKGTNIASYQSDWLVGFLLLSLFLLAIIRFSYNKYLTKIVNSVFNYQVAWNLFKEKNISNLRGAFILNLMFFLNGAIFLFELIRYNGWETTTLHGFKLFMLCFVALLGIYLLKMVGFSLIGHIFNGTRESREYIHSVFTYNKNLGLFLLPFIGSIPFIVSYAVPLLLKGGIAVALFLYLLRLLRGIKILFRKHVSIFYMILYLCALEILPLLMIFKLLVSWV